MSDEKNSWPPMVNDKGESIKGYDGDYVVRNDKDEIIGVITSAFFEHFTKYMNMLESITCIIHTIDKYPQGARSILKEVILKDDFMTKNGLNKDFAEKIIDKLVNESIDHQPPNDIYMSSLEGET